jgi:lambda repressor-like predicted transcriptional regulator
MRRSAVAIAETHAGHAVKDTLLPHGRYLVTKAMRERGLTVTKLAVELGISRKHLSNMLNAAVPLGEELADRIAAALDLAPEHLRVLRHDGVIPADLDRVEPFPITIIGDPTEPIPDWFEP